MLDAEVEMSEMMLHMIEVGLRVGLRGAPLRRVLMHDLGGESYRLVKGGREDGALQPVVLTLVGGGDA
jgi:hypothetical protein